MYEPFNDPRVSSFVSEVQAAMAVNLPDEVASCLKSFLTFTESDPPPAHIAYWSKNPSKQKWQRRHIEGISVHVFNALTCARYHQSNLMQLQEVAMAIYKSTEVAKSLTDRGISVGALAKWDAEYQAFVLAVRRCLDYLARAIAAYFHNDHNSFRTLPKLLQSVKPSTVGMPLIELHSKFSPRFEYVLSEGEKKSVRDLISHYEHVSAGCFNVNELGFTMAGGGEKERLRASGYRRDGGLGHVIEERATDLNQCVIEFLNTFIRQATAVEAFAK